MKPTSVDHTTARQSHCKRNARRSYRTLTSRRGRFVRAVGTMVDVVAHQVVGDALRHRLTFELSAIVDWNSNRKKPRF